MNRIYNILLRFDDICPTMNWAQWRRAKEVLDSVGVTAMLGVIPDNHDPALNIDAQQDGFWEYIKQLQSEGFTIAMHGYQHVFDIQAAGLSTPKKHSEFAGHPYKEQYRRISEGKRILSEHGIDTDVFFAPAHSYDDNTLAALAECGFKYISDGKSMKSYMRKNIVCFPELTGGLPRLNRYGNYFTAVFHAHEWVRKDRGDMFDKFKEFCMEHRSEIVSFDEYKKQPLGFSYIQRGTEKMYMCLSAIKHGLF